MKILRISIQTQEKISNTWTVTVETTWLDVNALSYWNVTIHKKENITQFGLIFLDESQIYQLGALNQS